MQCGTEIIHVQLPALVFQVSKTEVGSRRFIRSPTEKADMVTSFAIVINLPESFGSKEAKKMVRELKTEIKKEPPRVILDLSRVRTMDCAGLHGLLTCMQEIARYDCALQLRAVSPEAATLLELARMGHLFHKFPSLPAQAPGFTIAPASVAEEVKPEIMVQLQPVAA
jgi:anti-anti-sigma factor